MPVDLNKLGGHEFEDLVQQLLIKMGFKTEGRQPSADGGVDIVAVSSEPFVGGRYVVQCKRYSGSVSSPIIRDLYGVVNASNANKGILITTSLFTSDAIEFAKDKPIELIDGVRLVELLQKHSLLLSDTESKVSPSRLAVAMLRNEIVGFASQFEKSILNLDSSINLMGKKTLGTDLNERTYKKYREFLTRVLGRIDLATKASLQLGQDTSSFLRSPAPEPEIVRKIGREYRESIQFLLETYRETCDLVPLPRFSQTHEILKDMLRNYLKDFQSYMRQLEDILEKGVSGNIDYHIRVTRTNEMTTAFNEAWKKRFKRFP